MPRSNALIDPIMPSDQDVAVIRRIESVLPHAKLVAANGAEIPIPAPVYQALKVVIHLMAAGQPIHLVPMHLELTTQEAATLLNVSRPFLIKQLEKGAIPFTRKGTHRRIRLVDLLAYKAQLDDQRDEILDDLTQFSQDLDLP